MDEIEKKEEWYLNIDYREAKEIIRNKLQGMAQNFIGIGFYLRQIKETEGFQKDGYVSVYEFAEDQYGIKRSSGGVSRTSIMNNDVFGNNDPA